MNKQEVIDYILVASNKNCCQPTDMKNVNNAFMMAWSTCNYYFDVEVYIGKVEFCFSRDRKTTEFVTISDIEIADEEMLDKLLNQIFMRVRGYDDPMCVFL